MSRDKEKENVKGKHQKDKEKEPVKKPKETRAVPKSIVRVNSRDLNGDLPLFRALTSIKGVSHRIGKALAIALENETQIPFDSKLTALNEQSIKKLEEIIQNPNEHGVPVWSLNRRKERASGADRHLTMADLDFDLRNTLKRLGEIKSYRGLRHVWGLPVRGQRTKSTHRKRKGVVGVMKKDVTKPQKKGGS